MFNDELNRHPTLWITLISLLVLLSYAALKIKNEPNDYLRKARMIKFKSFQLLIPSWWSQTKNSENLIRFERLDTRYDWYAEFWTISQMQDPHGLLEELIKSLKVVFDEKSDFEDYFIDNKIDLPKLRIVRKEGMSTINGVERAYFDLFVAKSSKKLLVGKSHSSILNGCVEGPYFEEVINRLKDI